MKAEGTKERIGKPPWLVTAVELTKVLSIRDGKLYLAGKVIPDNQLIQLKSEAELIEKMTIWPILSETVRQEAISMGLNRSTEWEHVLTAKAMLVILDWQKGWAEAIRAVSIKK